MALQTIILISSWLFSFMAIYGSFLLAQGSLAQGFIVGVICNGFFCLLNTYHQDYSQAFLFLINFLISIHGINMCRRKQKKADVLVEK